ncbi:MAG TPA: hypothetical protein VEP73_01465 [Actinomycetota bacterium]|nr:hypothetical protein [Actinomycetota bacterium]
MTGAASGRPGRGAGRRERGLGTEAAEPLGCALGVAAALTAWLLAVPLPAAVLIGAVTWAVRAAAARRRPGLDPGGEGRADPPVAGGNPRVLAGAPARTRGFPPWPALGEEPSPVTATGRSALDRCLAVALAAGGTARRRVERVVDRTATRLTHARHDRDRHARHDRDRGGSPVAGDPPPPPGIAAEMLEPATLLLGLAAVAAAVLAGVPTAVAACTGAATVCVRAAAGALGRRAGPPGQRPASPIDPGSIEAQWLDRARGAAATFSEVVLSATSGPLAEQAPTMRLRIAQTVSVLEGLAARSSAARRVLERTDVQALAAEADRLRAEHAWTSGTVAALLGRSLAAVEARGDAHRQLQAARAGILARVEMGIVHLERLAAGATRLALASAPGPPPSAELDELLESLAALRPGLLEADAPAVDDPAWRAWASGAAASAG